MEKEEDHDTFQKGDSGAGLTFPCPCNDIRKGAHIMIKGFPCKVTDMSTSKTGKHGHAKANITAVDIFTNKKYEDIVPTSHNVDVPFVKKTEVDLISIAEDGTVTYIAENGENMDDLKLPEGEDDAKWVEDMKKSDEAGNIVKFTFMQAMGIEKIVSFREVKS